MINKKGFGAVEVIIIILVIGLLGAAGWLVYSKQNDKKETTTNQQVTKKTETPTKKQSTIPEGFVEYKNDTWGIAFSYPKDWTESAVRDDQSVYGMVYRVVSPAQMQKREARIEQLRQMNAQSDLPTDADIEISRWDSAKWINKNKSNPSDASTKYSSLSQYLADPESGVKEKKEINIGSQKAYEVFANNYNQSLLIMFEKPDSSVYQFDFVNVNSRSDINSTLQSVIDSIKVY